MYDVCKRLEVLVGYEPFSKIGMMSVEVKKKCLAVKARTKICLGKVQTIEPD